MIDDKIVITKSSECPFRTSSECGSDCNILEKMGAINTCCESFCNTFPDDCPLLRIKAILVELELRNIEISGGKSE